jgi:hypothetical protein
VRYGLATRGWVPSLQVIGRIGCGSMRYGRRFSLNSDLHSAVRVLDLDHLPEFRVFQDRLQQLLDIHALLSHMVPCRIQQLGQGILGRGQGNADLDRLLPFLPDLDA